MLRFKPVRIAALAVVAALLSATVAPAFASAATLKLSGSTTLQPLATEWAAAYHKAHPSIAVTVIGGGSGVGFTDPEAGRVDVGMSSRTKTSSDPSDLVMTTVARDAVAVIAHPKNAVVTLTPAQVKSIFTGKITNWHQISTKYPSKTIVLCGRTGASGTYAYFKSSFLGGSAQSSRTKTYTSNGMVRSAVAGNQWAIGYVSMAFINSKVKGVRINNIAPTSANAKSGKYSYVRSLFFVTKGAPKGNAAAFIAYCISSAGQKIAAKEYLTR